jgi:solute:Na+ symporter, SSS family
LKSFYSRVRPWGWGWKPIHQQILIENPDFQGNTNFKQDVFNILIGIIWQMAMVVAPIYFMIRDHHSAALCAVIIGLTTWLLKKNWWDRLEAQA